MLDAQGLHKAYAGRDVVSDVSLQLAPGRIVGLLGPNGAGKSTTVAMLCGLLSPDRGRVTIAGGTDPATPQGKRRIGLVPQELALFDDLPAARSLALFGALYGLAGRRLDERVAQALATVGLADRARDKPSTFSGGMKRRLNIACALVHDPDILLLDEPTVGVDPQSRNAIFDNLLALRAAGKTLLYTTHYMEEAQRLCDRIVVMDHGRVIADDTLAGLLRRLPAAQVLQVDTDAGIATSQLAADTGTGPVTQQGSRLAVVVDDKADIGAQASAVLTWLGARGHPVRHLATERATLEDVFLALTGRQLRD
jgi:ABC-2 type transport system ATP-binding protein